MAKYLLRERIEKIVFLIKNAQDSLVEKSVDEIDCYSLLAKASCFSVEQVCEHLIALEDELSQYTTAIPWKEIHGARVRIAHIYDRIEMPYIYKTIKTDFEDLKKELSRIANILD